MDIVESIENGRSCHAFADKPIAGAVLSDLESSVDYVCELSGLDIRLMTDNPTLFDAGAGGSAVRGCSCGIIFMAAGEDDDEAIGYWGQQIVVFVRTLGLSTCWTDALDAAALEIRVPEGEKARAAIAVGYGADDDALHDEQPIRARFAIEGGQVAPAWFEAGMRAVGFAPHLSDDPGILITLRDDGATVAIDDEPSTWNELDKGIARCNFELAASVAGTDWEWEEPLVAASTC